MRIAAWTLMMIWTGLVGVFEVITFFHEKMTDPTVTALAAAGLVALAVPLCICIAVDRLFAPDPEQDVAKRLAEVLRKDRQAEAEARLARMTEKLPPPVARIPAAPDILGHKKPVVRR